jgi:translation initiation factor 2B subunit (eIF-2B alpha/beta/delta family)
MSSDAEYILSGLRREYEALSNDVFALRNDVYFLTEQLKQEILFSDKLISIIRNGPLDKTAQKIIDELITEFGVKRQIL